MIKHDIEVSPDEPHTIDRLRGVITFRHPPRYGTSVTIASPFVPIGRPRNKSKGKKRRGQWWIK